MIGWRIRTSPTTSFLLGGFGKRGGKKKRGCSHYDLHTHLSFFPLDGGTAKRHQTVSGTEGKQQVFSRNTKIFFRKQNPNKGEAHKNSTYISGSFINGRSRRRRNRKIDVSSNFPNFFPPPPPHIIAGPSEAVISPCQRRKKNRTAGSLVWILPITEGRQKARRTNYDFPSRPLISLIMRLDKQRSFVCRN